MKHLTAILLMSTGVLFANLDIEKAPTTLDYNTNSMQSEDIGTGGWDDE